MKENWMCFGRKSCLKIFQITILIHSDSTTMQWKKWIFCFRLSHHSNSKQPLKATATTKHLSGNVTDVPRYLHRTSLGMSSALLLYRCRLHDHWGKLTGSTQLRWSDAELTLYWSHKTSLLDWQKQPPVSSRHLLSRKNTKQLATTTDAATALK